MRYSKTLLLTFIGLFILSGFQVPLASSQQSTLLQTGDQFVYDIDREEYRDEYRLFTFTNSSDPTHLFNYEEEINNVTILLDGFADVGIVRFVDGIGMPTDVDTVAVVESEAESLPGSQAVREYSRLRNDQGNTFWENSTTPEVYDLSGERSRDGDDDPENIDSNSTYSLIFEEMVALSINPFDDEDNDDGGGGQDGGNDCPFGICGSTFTGEIPLEGRDVFDTGMQSFVINGASVSIPITTVESRFVISHSEDFVAHIPFGDENDPNTVWEEVNATVQIDVNLTYRHMFDSDTGAFIGQDDELFFTVWSALWEDNIQIVHENDPFNPNDDTVFNLDLWIESETSFDTFSAITMESANNMYGESRPAPSGDNRLETGDRLKYDLEMNQEGSWELDIQVTSPTDVNSMVENRHNSFGSSGDVYLDIYWHQDSMFEALIFGELDVSGSFSYFRQSTENGETFTEDDSFELPPGFTQTLVDLQEFESSEDQDILPFFEDSRGVPDLFGDDDCEGGDCFRPPLPHEMLPEGDPVDEIVSVEDVAGDGTDNENILNINGFDYLFLQARRVSQSYLAEDNFDLNVPLGDGEDGEPPLMVLANFDFVSTYEESFWYDKDNGALVAVDQRLQTTLVVTSSTTVIIYDPQGIQVTAQVNLDLTVEVREDFSIMLVEHPHLYQEAQDLSTVTSSEPTTSSEPPTTEESSEGAGLPIPAPFLPFAIGFIAISVIIRKRR